MSPSCARRPTSPERVRAEERRSRASCTMRAASAAFHQASRRAPATSSRRSARARSRSSTLAVTVPDSAPRWPGSHSGSASSASNSRTSRGPRKSVRAEPLTAGGKGVSERAVTPRAAAASRCAAMARAPASSAIAASTWAESCALAGAASSTKQSASAPTTPAAASRGFATRGVASPSPLRAGGFARGSAKRSYRMGSSTSVSTVAVTSPPITTTASGRWISDPGPVAKRKGTSASAAMAAVSVTGVMRRFVPSRTACDRSKPSSAISRLM